MGIYTMSFKQFLLNEMALPADWDKKSFQGSFKKQLDYAMERAAKIGTGSSRVAFVVPFEGRDTVVKIAKNAKGLAQNAKEVDYGLHQMHGNVLIPLIDNDEENDPPRWIQFEKADKLTEAKFKSMTGFGFKHFGAMLQDWEQSVKPKRFKFNYAVDVPEAEKEKITKSELFEEVTDMCGNFGFLVGDFARLTNWGVFKNKPVIIDYGYDEEIQKLYYK
jgi:hypothetical protein